MKSEILKFEVDKTTIWQFVDPAAEQFGENDAVKNHKLDIDYNYCQFRDV